MFVCIINHCPLFSLCFFALLLHITRCDDDPRPRLPLIDSHLIFSSKQSPLRATTLYGLLYAHAFHAILAPVHLRYDFLMHLLYPSSASTAYLKLVKHSSSIAVLDGF